MPGKASRSSFVSWLLGTVEVLLSMAVVAWLLTIPALFQVYYPLLNVSNHPNDAAGVVQWLSSEHRERTLALAMTEGTLTAKELRHYSDVREVFRWFPRVTTALALLAAVLILITRRRSLDAVTLAQWCGLVVWGVLLVLVGGLALWDWKGFFAYVHQPFFGDRSWRMPAGSYSLVLFPSSFWRIIVGCVLLAPVLPLFFGFTLFRMIHSRSTLPEPAPKPAPGKPHCSISDGRLP